MGGRKITGRVYVPDGVGKTSLRASGAPTEFESELTKSNPMANSCFLPLLLYVHTNGYEDTL